jgi:hypothetical protein
VLVVCLGLAAVVTLGYLPAQGFGPFLALSWGMPRRWRRSPSWRMPWRWVRGTGSAAFIGGTLLAGQAVSA